MELYSDEEEEFSSPEEGSDSEPMLDDVRSGRRKSSKGKVLRVYSMCPKSCPFSYSEYLTMKIGQDVRSKTVRRKSSKGKVLRVYSMCQKS